MLKHTAVRTTAAAALTLAGLAIPTGAAHAATAITCTTAFAFGSATLVNLSGCGAYTDKGAPYTIFIETYYYDNSLIDPVIRYVEYDITITCQSFAPADAGFPLTQASGCTVPVFQGPLSAPAPPASSACRSTAPPTRRRPCR
jgi:hypothetical protein